MQDGAKAIYNERAAIHRFFRLDMLEVAIGRSLSILPDDFALFVDDDGANFAEPALRRDLKVGEQYIVSPGRIGLNKPSQRSAGFFQISFLRRFELGVADFKIVHSRPFQHEGDDLSA